MSSTTSTPENTDTMNCKDLLEAMAQLEAHWRDDFSSENLPSNIISFPLLQELGRKFSLNEIEQSLLLLLAIKEINPYSANSEIQYAVPTIRTWADFIQIFPQSIDPRILLSGSTLCRWQLIELGESRLEPLPLAHTPLKLSQRILAYLLDSNAPDPRISTSLDFNAPLPILTPLQKQCALQISKTWQEVPHFGAFRTIALQGSDSDALKCITMEAANDAGFRIATLKWDNMPGSPEERNEWSTLWQIEALLTNHVLYLDATSLSNIQTEAAMEWLAHCAGPVIVGHLDAGKMPPQTIRMHAPETSSEDREQLITAVLNGHAPTTPHFAKQLAGQFKLGATALYEACIDASNQPTESENTNTEEFLWRACRDRSRPQIGALAQVIESKMDWSDLVLPPSQIQLLREAADQVKEQFKVHNDWGFAAKSKRGLNLTALFSGASGTGKTLAAEVMANHLQLDLIRVDLSAVISKYIGETEKNLNEVFRTVEAGGSVILFDEADALFGPRSKVNDSRDRHANIEVSFLLQRLESFQGLALLTTNFKENLDHAFLRRIRFHVEFPFPDRATRAELWRHAFPSETPLGQLNFDRLSRLSLTGGNIRNIALNAAFQAASAGDAVQTPHIISAARAEFQKAEKPVPEGDLRALLTVV